MRTSLNYYKADHFGLDRTSQSVFTALGRGEVAMTKGLAAVLASDPKLAVDLALSSPLRSAVEQLGITEEALRVVTDLTVDSEERQTPGSGMRRDLVLRFLQDSHRVLTVIIEAKHTDLAASVAVVQQVENYLDVQGCLDRYGDRKVGLTLTKAEIVSARKDIASMTWTRATEILIASGSAMARQFAHHVRESMSLQHFEVEVYSVPAGHSSAAVEANFVHAFPQSYGAPVCLYLAPRNSRGGEIPRLYRVERVYDISTAQLEEQLARIEEEDKAGTDIGGRLRGYFADRLDDPDQMVEDLRVFVLGTKPIELPHRPRPKRNNAFKTGRWTLADFLDSKNPVLP